MSRLLDLADLYSLAERHSRLRCLVLKLRFRAGVEEPGQEANFRSLDVD